MGTVDTGHHEDLRLCLPVCRSLRCPYPYGYHPAAVPAVYTAAVKNVEVKPAEVKTTVHSPVVYTHAASPLVYNTAALPVAHAASYYANSGGAVHIVKREAEAAYYYGGYYHHPYAYSGYRSYYPYAYRPYG